MGVLELAYSVKRFLHRKAIDLGVLDPGAAARHGWVGPTACAEMKREFQISFQRRHGLLPSHRLLDIGCGSLRGGIPMIRYLEVGNYCGIDVRAQVLAEARKELEDSGLQDKAPVLLLMDQADSQIPDQLLFDRVWIFNTMIHMHDPILMDTIKFVSRHLSPLGVCHGTVYLGKRQTEGDWQGFPGVYRPLLFYEDVAAEAGLEIKVLGTLDSLGYAPQEGRRSEMVMLEFTHSERSGGDAIEA